MIFDDDRLAADLAAEAGRRLLKLRADGGDPDALRHAGDRLSHEFLAAELARLRPDDALLSEGGDHAPARLSPRRGSTPPPPRRRPAPARVPRRRAGPARSGRGAAVRGGRRRPGPPLRAP